MTIAPENGELETMKPLKEVVPSANVLVANTVLLVRHRDVTLLLNLPPPQPLHSLNLLNPRDTDLRW